MSLSSEEIKNIYYKLSTLFESLCLLHQKMLDLVIQEKAQLIEGTAEELEKNLKEKLQLIEKIEEVNKQRQQLLEGELHLTSLTQALEYFSFYEQEQNIFYLSEFSHLLVEIISNIQEENKRNKLLIQNALFSLEEIKGSSLGIKNHTLYTSKGKKITSKIYPEY